MHPPAASRYWYAFSLPAFAAMDEAAQQAKGGAPPTREVRAPDSREEALAAVRAALLEAPAGAAGAFCFDYRRDPVSGFVRLWQLQVPEARRRRGWATALVRELCDHAARAGVPAVVVGPIVCAHMRAVLAAAGGFAPRPCMPLDAWRPLAPGAQPF
jgi:hypothetical protein